MIDLNEDFLVFWSSYLDKNSIVSFVGFGVCVYIYIDIYIYVFIDLYLGIEFRFEI